MGLADLPSDPPVSDEDTPEDPVVTPEAAQAIQDVAVENSQTPDTEPAVAPPPPNPLFFTSDFKPVLPGGVAGVADDEDLHPPADAITVTHEDAPATLGPAVSVDIFQPPNGEPTS